MIVLYIKLTDGYTDSFTYQENILPGKFVQLGHEVHLVVSPRSRDNYGKKIIRKSGKYVDKKGVCVHILPFSRRFRKITRKLDYYDTLLDTIQEIRPDFIFVHGLQFASVITVGEYVKENSHVNLVVDNHADYVIMPLNTLRRVIIQKVFYKSYARIIQNEVKRFYGVSPSRATYLSEVYGIKQEQIGVITQGGDEQVVSLFDHFVERDKICKALNLSEDKTLLITGAGNIDKKKCLSNLFSAVTGRNDVNVIVFGTFTDDEKKDCSHFLKQKNIIYIGRISEDDIYRYIIACDLAIYPGQHSVLWDQTVACGTPICVRRWSGMDYFNVNGNCVYLEDGSSAEITEVLNRINFDGKLEKMRISAQGEPKKRFSYLNIAEQVLSIK